MDCAIYRLPRRSICKGKGGRKVQRRKGKEKGKEEGKEQGEEEKRKGKGGGKGEEEKRRRGEEKKRKGKELSIKPSTTSGLSSVCVCVRVRRYDLG